MKEKLKKYLNVYSLCCLVAVALSIAQMIVGPVTHGFAAQTYDWRISLFLGIGIVFTIATFFTSRNKYLGFMPYLSTVFYAIAFGLMAYSGSHVIADHYNKVNYVNGTYDAVVIYCVLGGIILIASVVAVFFYKDEPEVRKTTD